MKPKRCKRKDDCNKYFCFICNANTIMNAAELTDHYSLKHPNDRIFYRKIEDFVKLSHVCDICGSLSDTIREAEEHLNQHDIQHRCSHCGSEFRKLLEYAMHVYDHTKLAKCELCNKTLKGRNNLQNHYAIHLSSMNPYLCEIPECNRRFQILHVYREHLQRHAGVKNYQCDKCPSSFITEPYLKAHLQGVHSAKVNGKVRNYECVDCGVKYKFVAGLKRHNIKMHSNRRHICDKCGKKFLTNHELKEHGAYHEEKTLQCKYCDRKFHLKKGLKSHEITHTGEKPYPCRYCDKRFAQFSVRQTHERLHTNEKPYTCDICGKGYTSRAARNSHKNNCNGLQ